MNVPAGPSKLGFSLTRQCNASCIMCSRRRQRGWGRPSDETPIERIRDLITKYRKPLRSIDLGSFGEPLLHSAFEGVVSSLAELAPGIPVNIPTNGSLLHEHLSLLQLPGMLTVSLDAPTSSMFERIRPGLSFSHVVDNLQLVADSPRHCGRRIGINMVVMRRNAHLVYSTARLASSLGLDYFCPVRVYTFDRPGLRSERMPDDSIEVVDQIAAIRADLPHLQLIDYFTDRYGLLGRPHGTPHCLHPWQSLDFTPRGRAFVCCWTTDLDLGTWNSDPWTDAPITELRRQVAAKDIDATMFPSCASCPLR